MLMLSSLCTYHAATRRCSKERYSSPPVHTNVNKYAKHNIATCINL